MSLISPHPCHTESLFCCWFFFFLRGGTSHSHMPLHRVLSWNVFLLTHTSFSSLNGKVKLLLKVRPTHHLLHAFSAPPTPSSTSSLVGEQLVTPHSCFLLLSAFARHTHYAPVLGWHSHFSQCCVHLTLHQNNLRNTQYRCHCPQAPTFSPCLPDQWRHRITERRQYYYVQSVERDGLPRWC